jgi:DNA-binding NarL/FixJ family response regulator
VSDAPTCVVADDHPPVLAFLARFLAENGIAVSATAADGEAALRKIEELRPSVAVLDARMPRLSGIDVTRALAASRFATRVVLYTGYADYAVVRDALDAGVAGVVDKEAPLDDLLRAIRIVVEGGSYLDSALAALPAAERAHPLTAREREVLRALADGNTNEQIGAALGISPQTVRTHVQKSIEKLGATTRVQAVATALRESLIS